MASLLVATAASQTAGSTLVRTALAYIMHLTTNPQHVLKMGGLVQVSAAPSMGMSMSMGMTFWETYQSLLQSVAHTDFRKRVLT